MQCWLVALLRETTIAGLRTSGRNGLEEKKDEEERDEVNATHIVLGAHGCYVCGV